MLDKSPKLFWGAVAFGIYFLCIGLLMYYFNTRKSDDSRHYVKKDEKRIQVTLLAPMKKKVTKPKPKKNVTQSVKSKPKKKPPVKKNTKKKVIKEKIVKKIPKKKKDENRTKPKINKPKISKPKKVKKKKTVDLFSNVKTKKMDVKLSDTPVPKQVKKNPIKVTKVPPSALAKINKSLKEQKSMDSGVENAYFAKVQGMLQAWPARSEFLGEEATLTLFIKPTGKFEYKITSSSNDEAFSKSVIDFLNQLQNIGFGRHNAGRTYEFEVEFSTKE